jgi:hypothetical protein
MLNMQDREPEGQAGSGVPFLGSSLDTQRRTKPLFVLSCSAKKEPKKAARKAGASPAWPGRERAQHIALIRSPAPPMRRPGKRG